LYRFALYPSNHGFGHATRMAALAAALIDFGVYVYICTDRPEYLYESLPEDKCSYRKCRLDGGVVHGENLKVDLSATRAMLLELFSHREELVAQETLWLQREQIDLVIADIPPKIPEPMAPPMSGEARSSAIMFPARSLKLVPYPVIPAVRLLWRLTDSLNSSTGRIVKRDTAIKPLRAFKAVSFMLPRPCWYSMPVSNTETTSPVPYSAQAR